MRLGPAVFLIMACAGPALAQGVSGPFATVLPEGVGDVAGWEIVTGEFATKTARGAYWFYGNPARPGLYQLMRYRVELLNPEGASARERGSAERVAFVRRPSVREPISCWEKQAPGLTPAWRRIDAGSAEYKLEISVLLNVIAVHRSARASQHSP
jgi:hypothetical protein